MMNYRRKKRSRKPSYWNAKMPTMDWYIREHYPRSQQTSRKYNAAWVAKNMGPDALADYFDPKQLGGIKSYIKSELGKSPGKRLKQHVTKLTGKAHVSPRAAPFAEVKSTRVKRPKAPPPAPPPPPPPKTFKRGPWNLENDQMLAQGHHTPWAQTTSISHLITSLLKESQTTAADYWDTFFQDKPVNYKLEQSSSSPWGVDPIVTGPKSTASQAAMDNPMGLFGAMSMVALDEEGNFKTSMVDENGNPFPNQYVDENGNPIYTVTGGTGADDPPGPTTPTTPTPPTPPTGSVYNPWGYGEGAKDNDTGANQGQMTQATMEALALANAYFAPQRLELAHELGDMETDMRRLAVNLGRQVDDPILQAKLYKEGMRAIRTLDTQQNTFAFQMAEQRRREEVQNNQFYSQLAHEEYKLRLSHYQFLKQLELQGQYFNLQRWQVMNPPGAPATTPPTSTDPLSPTISRTVNQYNPPVIQADADSIYGGGNLLRYNPYGR